MVKYTDYQVVFREIPDEVTLAINISNCQNNCEGCHSSYLKENIGKELTNNEVDSLIDANKGISCVCFMGEGNDIDTLLSLAKHVKESFKNLKVAVYSGREKVEDEYYNIFDYVKVGPYKKEYGPLNSQNTNQRMYRVIGKDIMDITYKFWR